VREQILAAAVRSDEAEALGVVEHFTVPVAMSFLPEKKESAADVIYSLAPPWSSGSVLRSVEHSHEIDDDRDVDCEEAELRPGDAPPQLVQLHRYVDASRDDRKPLRPALPVPQPDGLDQVQRRVKARPER